MRGIDSPLLALLVLVFGCLAGLASAQIGASDDYYCYDLKYTGEDNFVIGSG